MWWKMMGVKLQEITRITAWELNSNKQQHKQKRPQEKKNSLFKSNCLVFIVYTFVCRNLRPMPVGVYSYEALVTIRKLDAYIIYEKKNDSNSWPNVESYPQSKHGTLCYWTGVSDHSEMQCWIPDCLLRHDSQHFMSVSLFFCFLFLHISHPWLACRD